MGPLRELEGLRTVDSDTFESTRGVYVTRVYSEPVNYRTGRGVLEPINDRLKRRGGVLVVRADSDRLRLPLRLGRPATYAGNGGVLRLRLLGVRGAARASVAGNVATYRSAYPGVTVSFEAIPGSLAFSFALANRRARHRFGVRVSLGRGVHARLVHGGLVVSGRGGRVVFRVPAPMLLERTRHHRLAPSLKAAARVRVSLERVRGGVVLRYVISRRWLTARGRVFPVVLDPQVNAPPLSDGDCTIYSGAPTSDQDCVNSAAYDVVGTDGGTYETLMNFPDLLGTPASPNGIPADSEVLGATLNMDVEASNNGAVPYEVLPLQDSFSTDQAASWDDSDTGTGTGTPWNCPGGDFLGCEPGSSQSAPVAGYGNFYGTGVQTVSLTALVQSWVDGSYSSGQAEPALMLTPLWSPTSTTDTADIYRVGSSTGTPPYLSVYYTPRLGADPGSSVDTSRPDSTTSLGVNVANANVQVTSSDLHVAGIAGMDLDLSHTYNSDAPNGGWTLDQPPSLTSYASDAEALTEPDGNVSVWNALANPLSIDTGPSTPVNETYSPPPGVSGSLCQAVPGSGPNAMTGGGGQQDVAFVNSSNQIEYAQLINGTWTDLDLGGSVDAGTTPSVMTDYAGNVHIFYNGANGDLWQWYTFGNQWVDEDFGATMRAGSSPSAIGDGVNVWAAYIGTNNQVYQWYWNGSTGVIQGLGGSVDAGTNISQTINPNNVQDDFYVSGGQLWQLYWNNGWVDDDLNEPVDANTSPSAVPTSVAYVSSGQMDQFYWNGSGWQQQPLGGNVEAGTSPFQIKDGSGMQHIAYTGTNQQIWELYYNGSSWDDPDLGTSATANGHSLTAIGSPTMTIAPSGAQYVTYEDNDDQMAQLVVNSTNGTNVTNTFLDPCQPEYAGASWELTFYNTGQRWDFNAAGQLIAEYDRNGNPIYYADDGRALELFDTEYREITYDYNAADTLTAVEESNVSPSRAFSYGYTGSQLTSVTDTAGRTTTYGYDSVGQLDSVTDPDGNVTQINYPALPGYGAQYEVDVTRAAPRSGGSTLTTQYLYFSDATMDGRVPSGYPACGTDPGGEEPYGYTIITEPDGVWSVACYDTHDRVYQTIDEYGHRTTTTYNADDEATAVEDPLGDVTSSTYDACDRLTSTTTGGGGPRSTASYSGGIGANGVCAATTPTQYEAASATIPAGTGGGALTTKYFYDADGNVLQETESNGKTLRFTYSRGQMVTSTDATATGAAPGTANYEANTTKYAYTYTLSGPYRRGEPLPTATLSSLVVTPPAPLAQTTTTYDVDGRVASSTDGDGNVTTFSYNGDDQVLSDTFADASTITNSYDGDGNILSSVDSAGGTTSYSYDADNRLTSETDPGVGGQPATTVSYGYDGDGDLTSFTDGGGTVSYGYNDEGVATSVQEPGVSAPIRFSYDAAGRLICTLYPNAVAVQDAYDAYSEVTSIQAATGTGTNAGCDKTSPTNTPYGTLFSSDTYTYGTPGNETGLRQTETSNGTTDSYAYNNLNELVGVSGGASYNYSYDANGNVVSRTDPVTGGTLQMAYNAADEICDSSESGIPSCATAAYSYDGAGNETADAAGNAMAYNDRGQTSQITPAGAGGQTLAYNGTGQTGLTQIGSAPTGTGAVAPVLENSTLGVSAEESAASSQTASTTTYFTRAPDGTLLGERTPSGDYYYVEDANGSIVALTDSSGNVANTYTYDPYGITVTSTGATPNPFGFDSGLQLPDGLYHFGARDYNPTTGNWTQPDPAAQTLVTDPVQSDPYSFAGDDPVNNVDRAGLCFIVSCSVYHAISRAAKDTYHFVRRHVTAAAIASVAETEFESLETVAFSGVDAVAAGLCVGATDGWVMAACGVPAAAAVTGFIVGGRAVYYDAKRSIELFER